MVRWLNFIVWSWHSVGIDVAVCWKCWRSTDPVGVVIVQFSTFWLFVIECNSYKVKWLLVLFKCNLVCTFNTWCHKHDISSMTLVHQRSHHWRLYNLRYVEATFAAYPRIVKRCGVKLARETVVTISYWTLHVQKIFSQRCLTSISLPFET